MNFEYSKFLEKLFFFVLTILKYLSEIGWFQAVPVLYEKRRQSVQFLPATKLKLIKSF